jgi:hypothetical protein
MLGDFNAGISSAIIQQLCLDFDRHIGHCSAPFPGLSYTLPAFFHTFFRIWPPFIHPFSSAFFMVTATISVTAALSAITQHFFLVYGHHISHYLSTV